MTADRNRPRRGNLLVYAGIGVLVFALGAVLGMFVLSQLIRPPVSPTAEPFAPTEAPSPTSVTLVTMTPTAGVEPTATPSIEPPAPTVTATPCGPVPAGWVPYTVRAGDTLFGLASQVGLSQESVVQANCLVSPELLTGQVLYLPFNPCTPAPLPGWTRYTVRAGDTLFSLAVTRGASVDEVTRVNCLSSPSIRVGQTLYLPPSPIPPPPPTLPPPAPQATPKPDSPFSERAGALDALVLAPGGPNDPNFVPCAKKKGFAWISVETESGESNDLQHGQWAYYFACEFSDPATLTARMTGPVGAQPFDVLLYVPNPDLQMGKAQGVVAWSATCDLPIGLYTLTIQDDQGKSAQLTFNLSVTDIQRILPVPRAALAGTTFQVYYCGYTPNTTVEIDLYYLAARLSDGELELRHADSWSVTIGAGWAKQQLPSSPDDAGILYLLQDRDPVLDGEVQLRLIR